MPRNLSAWPDFIVHLGIMLTMICVLSQYNKFLGAISFLLWVMLVLFAKERTVDRRKKFEEYCENVVGSGREMMHYAMTNLPQSVMIIDTEGRMEWCNELTKDFAEKEPQQGMLISEFWDGILSEDILEEKKDSTKHGSYIAKVLRTETSSEGENFEIARYFRVRYRHMTIKEPYPQLIVLFVDEITLYQKLKEEYTNSRTVVMYVQMDNYDEIMKGLNEAEKNALTLAVSQELENWMTSLSGFMQRVSPEMFVIVLERAALDKAIEEKFSVLDKVRQIHSKNNIPATLSMGIAVAEKHSSIQSMTELGKLAQDGLNSALARGGDQVAINLGGKTQYFGGRAKAVEKHNRVRARVIASIIRGHMEEADEIFVMGHAREDFDCFGAAVGIAAMAKHLEKPVHIVLSNSTDGIEKILEQFDKEKNKYPDVFVKPEDLSVPSSLNPLLIVVDTHIPYLAAAPNLLERIQRVVVIDHHRKSDNIIKNPLVFYHEQSSSSASELVTELLMYFDEKVNLGKLVATALYSGIVVDTKSFVVQTGVRTFDAAAYLRRNGADPVIVRELFQSDYETTVELAKTKAESQYYKGGLVVSCIENIIPNVQAVAGQAADSMLTIDSVQMTIVLFKINDSTIGISARSKGELNVQVIMEKFGGGGHQTVAGAQVKNISIQDLKDQVVEVALEKINEN